MLSARDNSQEKREQREEYAKDNFLAAIKAQFPEVKYESTDDTTLDELKSNQLKIFKFGMIKSSDWWQTDVG
ncbi:unnamed protein product [Allacma fusca]|uniref:Uncharacterized protein n=1 Tax=Allacma fusca TaxID=39272 RepID=A0A8J2JIL7_9HEXA|nr:unnamed protein product [Allacma fusca]